MGAELTTAEAVLAFADPLNAAVLELAEAKRREAVKDFRRAHGRGPGPSRLWFSDGPEAWRWHELREAERAAQSTIRRLSDGLIRAARDGEVVATGFVDDEMERRPIPPTWWTRLKLSDPDRSIARAEGSTITGAVARTITGLRWRRAAEAEDVPAKAAQASGPPVQVAQASRKGGRPPKQRYAAAEKPRSLIEAGEMTPAEIGAEKDEQLAARIGFKRGTAVAARAVVLSVEKLRSMIEAGEITPAGLAAENEDALAARAGVSREQAVAARAIVLSDPAWRLPGDGKSGA